MSEATTGSPKVPPAWFVHTAWRVHRALYRLSGGRFVWTPASKRGWGALHLTTLGRTSEQERGVIIGYLEDGPDLVTLAMNGWQEGHPSWWRCHSRSRSSPVVVLEPADAGSPDLTLSGSAGR